MKKPRNWTMETLDREAKKIAAGKTNRLEVRWALIALHGHPER